MKVKNQRIISFVLGITVGLLLLLFNCNPKPIKPDTKIVTQIEHTSDTIYIPRYITIKEDKSSVKIDENNTYSDSIHSNRYYNQTFTDSNYTLNTYGGFVDSIDLVVKCEDKIIYDSTIITNTITKTYTNTTMYKHSIGVDYMYNSNNNVIVDYTRNFNRLGLSIGTGLNLDTKSLLIKAGLRYSF